MYNKYQYKTTRYSPMFLDKTTAILGGTYGIIVLILAFVLVFEPQKFDNPLQTSTINSLVQTDKSPQLNLADLFSKSQDGVVQIIVRKSTDNSSERAIGSGIVYDLDGRIITNNHVVNDSQKIRVVFHEGESFSARVVGTDPFADLAVVKINPDPKLLHPLILGDSSSLRIGDAVVAIGSPFGLSGSMTAGIVSQLGRVLTPPNQESFSIPNIIQTDTAINPGNSGGPLLNNHGLVIGINTAIESGTGEFSGIGFAIPSNTMKKIVPILIRDGHYRHPWIGVSGISIDADISNILGLPVTTGFLIQDIVPESPAANAGLHGYQTNKTADGVKYKVGGDIVIGVDKNPVKKLEDILNYLQDQKSVGDKMTLQIIRDGKSINVDLILQERPTHKQ